MDEGVNKAIEILNEDLREPGLNGQSRVEQSSKVNDAPRNCGDGILQMMPGSSARAKKDLAANVKRAHKKISEALTVLRYSLHRDAKARAKESIRNQMLIRSRCHTISRDSIKPSKSKCRVCTVARKRTRNSPAKKRKGKRVRKDTKPIMFVTKSSSTSQSKSLIESFSSGSSRDDVSQRGFIRRS